MQNWTCEQEKAIETRNCNILVAAAAGSGKTAVLVERIVRMISEGKNAVDIDKLLIVTFTNAAAAEMRERIGDAIVKKLDDNPQNYNLQRQLSLLNKASITTIHSFCLEVIRNNFHLIDLDPDFRIADDTEALLLKQEVVQELFDESYENAYENNESDFLKLIECYGGRDDTSVIIMVLSLYEFVMSGPWPKEWLESASENFNVDSSYDFGSSVYADVLLKCITMELNGLKSMLLEGIEIAETADGIEKYCDTLNEDLSYVDMLIKNADSFNNLRHAVSNEYNFTNLKRCDKNADKDAKEFIQKIRKSLKDKIKEIKERYFCVTNEETISSMRQIYPVMKELCKLVYEFKNKYSEKKREKKLLDFSDLEHLCLDILTIRDEIGNIKASNAALNYRKTFSEILIDEYQDSNNVQETILNIISRNEDNDSNIFMVGDVKQSIYRFRQADPGLFLKKYYEYSKKEANKSNRKICLYKNFRSRKNVIDMVNLIFSSIMSKDIGELEYDQNEALNMGADYPKAEFSDRIGEPCEFDIIETDSSEDNDVKDNDAKDNNDDETEDLTSLELEARLVSQKIKDVIGIGDKKPLKVYDKNIKEYRDCQFRDIVILLRATGKPAPVFSDTLLKMDIPVYADTGSGFFQSVEIQIVMSLLKIIDNPIQDIPLIAVLRSPIFSFSPDELSEIRLADINIPFYEALKLISNGEESSLCDKCSAFLKQLKIWRDKAVYMPIDELIWSIYGDTDYYVYVSAMPGGIQRQANLKILFERAKQYGKTSYKGLFNFINFVNRLKSSSGDMGSAKIIGENENVVRIMSIHKSKGLEFPVVIAACMGKKFNLSDMNRSILYHKELGIGPDFVDYERRISYPTLIKQAIRQKIKIENLSEEMRILYVALTRAKEKLIMTGTVRSIGDSMQKWENAALVNGSENKIFKYEIFKAKSFLDWIGAVIARYSYGENSNNLFTVKFLKRNDIYDDEAQNDEENDNDITNHDISSIVTSENISSGLDVNDEILRRLKYQYPYNMSSQISGKVSVTELKRQANIEVDDEFTYNIFKNNYVEFTKEPSFMSENTKITGSGKGTAYHFVMQHIKLSDNMTIKYIKDEIEAMTAREMLTREEADAIYPLNIKRFFEAEIGKRMFASDNIKREQPFYIRLKSTSVYKKLPEIYSDEKVLLQGVIDCCFEENNEWVLIDYKTDYVTDENICEIKQKYKSQIEYYSYALNVITGKNVKEKYIYLLSRGELIAM